MTVRNEEPCACMWQVEYADGHRSHIHLCELRHDHGFGLGGGPLVHQCRCGAARSGDFRPICSASRDGHTCMRIHWHANRLPHKCHCGQQFHTGVPNRPFVVRSTGTAPIAASPTLPN